MEMKKKICMDMYFLGVFLVAAKRKKCVKNEKKKREQTLIWATAQLCHDTMENCIVT